MHSLIPQLQKRRKIAMLVVVLLAMISLIVSYTIHISPSRYFGGLYNQWLVYGLILYKIIELLILYHLLFYRHIRYLRFNPLCDDYMDKLRKHSKLLFFLIPQGNTIFGIIAYKLSGEVKYFLIFSSIALMTLFIINPNRLNVTVRKPR